MGAISTGRDLWELGDKLLHPAKRCRLSASQVGQPMHEIECYVTGTNLALRDQLLELAKECAWWGFCLYQPTMIKPKIGLESGMVLSQRANEG